MRSLAVHSKRAFFHVRRRAAYVAIVIATAALTGCNGADQRYIQNGIGADLYSADVRQATANLETYLGFICRQTGIDSPTAEDGFPRCNYGSMQTIDWTLLVQTGFNDIDRRCDSYLAWLEYVRHRDRFYSSQLNQVSRLTNAILVATSPADAIAISIVGQAFGYAQSLFNDYQARIMLGYESSTIKTIVSERRLDFRIKFADARFKFKPDAVHALRSYLRICMPYTITMDANAFARATATGTSSDLMSKRDPARIRESLVAVKTSEDTASGGTRPGIAKRSQLENVTAMFGPGSGRGIPDVKKVQIKLCVPADGKVGPTTKTAIMIYRRDLEVKTGDTGPLSLDEATSIRGLSDCNRDVYLNYYEIIALSEKIDEDTEVSGLSTFIEAFNENVDEFNKTSDEKLEKILSEDKVSSKKESSFRNKISKLKSAVEYSDPDVRDKNTGHVTPSFDAGLARGLVK